jgi:hypothetical protein
MTRLSSPYHKIYLYIYKSSASCSGDVSRELLGAAIRGTVGSLVLFTVDVGVLDGQTPNIEIVTESNDHGVLGTSSTTNKSLRQNGF